ncbi:dTMP kinase [Candidatus Falkowbacteria bacterium]|nr:dTMP kinase [Candidatus Falkowbacteria bacterium]
MRKNPYKGKFTRPSFITLGDSLRKSFRKEDFCSRGGSFDKKMGWLIVFEGLDGSGLSTQTKLLGDYLKVGGHGVILTKEPTMDSEAGRQIRTILDKKIKTEPAEIQKLFVRDRKEHLENLIIPALEKGKVVISDRYFFSTFAFGAVDSDLEWLIGLNKDFLLPDLTIFLLVRPETCIERIIKRGDGIKLFEKLPTLERVYENYKIIAERFSIQDGSASSGKNVCVINGEGSVEEVFEEIKNKISKLFKSSPILSAVLQRGSGWIFS